MLEQTLQHARTLIFDAPASEEWESQAALGRAEALVLDRQPLTGEEALLILDVLLINVQTGERPDGRDAGAIKNLKAWISSLILDGGRPAAASETCAR